MKEGILAANFNSIQSQIDQACHASGRASDEIRLIAVSKYVEAPVIEALYHLGQKDFGENRIQIASPKINALQTLPLCWHFIGHLQTNKVRQVIESFHVIHSIDRESLILELIRQLARKAELEPCKPFPVFLQVNISGEASKSGVEPGQAEKLGQMLIQSPLLDWAGLMTLAPEVEDPGEVRPVFRNLRLLRDQLESRLGVRLPRLSMGMSQDFQVALMEGATDIRIGSALYRGLI
ncbi:MAG: YggS family pyridoxal phosphate-dependent enzyme [Candidatus Omnitrophica bacterium COP1]|nr:YggS family pyridoxal phosphate-dependent enzyme [Candidatus Omnitrophica bacterium COP1]